MIPKKLHYCWFGPNQKTKIFEECFLSWKKYCPDFEIIEWNDNNTRNIPCSFFKDALRKKKYAFAADYIRTKVLLEQGGIYLDTDMLLLKPINDLLNFNFFIGEEVKGRVAFGFYGAKPQNHLLKIMLQYYENNYFNSFSPPVITHTFINLLKFENLNENEIIFPPEIFYPLPYELKNEDYREYISNISYAVHLWDHSWEIEKNEETMMSLLRKMFTVFIDFFIYRYPYVYFKRYTKEFGRKLYQNLIK